MDIEILQRTIDKFKETGEYTIKSLRDSKCQVLREFYTNLKVKSDKIGAKLWDLYQK